jgi:hypothetical protein
VRELPPVRINLAETLLRRGETDHNQSGQESSTVLGAYQ